jgi:hypothetical protein
MDLFAQERLPEFGHYPARYGLFGQGLDALQ